MKNNSFSLGIYIIFVVLVASGGWSTADAKGKMKLYRLEPGKTIELGKQGIAVTNIPYGVTSVLAGVTGETLPPKFNHEVDIEHRAPVMEVQFMNDNGGKIRDISALVYVFFNIGMPEELLWYKEGTDGIAIWYYDEYVGQWEMCPTFFVGENLDNGTYNRLACLAPGSGYFALGHVEYDELLFKPLGQNDHHYNKKHIPE